MTEALQELPANSPGVGTLEAMRAIARCGHIPADDSEVLLLIGEIRGGMGAQLVELAARYSLTLDPTLASLAGSHAPLVAVRQLELDAQARARELNEGARASMRGYPQELLYHEGHTWLDRTTHGVIVGITEHAQDALAEVAHIDLPQPGASIAQSGTLAEIESLKCVWELESPISGVVLTINPMLPERPELLNDDPYVAGWIVEMRATVPTEFETLLGADAYEGLLQ